MKTKLLFSIALCLLIPALEAQVQKVETYLVGTKVTYYPNQCGNTIPEAQGKISFCDSRNNLGVVEASYGLSYRAIKQMAPNYYNTDEVFITEAGISIRKTDGTWNNIPEFTAPRTNLNGNSPQMRKAIVNSQGYMFFYHGSNWGLHYLDLATSIYNTLSYATDTGGSNGNYTHSFAYDETNDVTYVVAQFGGNSGYKIYKYENSTLSYLGGLPAAVTGENSESKLIVANEALYFGTSTGLYKLNKDTIALEGSYFTDSSEYVNNIQDVVNDGNGNLWLANRNNNDSAIYKFNIASETIIPFQLAKTATTNYSFNNLDIDANGSVWATASNLSGFVELEPDETNPVWTVRSMEDIRELGFNMTYSPGEVYRFNGKIYIMVTANSSSSSDINYEAIVNDNGVWSGITDDEPNNLSDKMLRRYYFAYPDTEGVWFYNFYDGGILSHMSITDDFKKQFNLGGTNSFILDVDGNPVINYQTLKKVYMPYVANLPSHGSSSITQYHRYKDQIWMFSNSARKIFVYKHNQLIQTFNLDETGYSNWYDFTPDINGNAFFAKNVGSGLEFKKFDTTTQTTTTYPSTTNLGGIKELISLPNGNVAVICGGGIFLFDGTTLTSIGASDFSELYNVVAGVSDTNGKIWLLTNDSTRLLSIENPESATPIFSSIQVEGGSGLIPFNSFYRPKTLSIDANGAFWSHTSKKWMKITTDNTAPQFLNEGVTYGITGNVYVDINENNQFDTGEGYPNQKLTLKTSSGAIYELYSKSDGSYYFPYFEGLGTYEITLPVLSPYVVAPERQRIVNVSDLNANTNVTDIQLQPKNIESLVIKSSAKQGAWAFTRANFENTFTTAIGNLSYTKTFNNVDFDYVFFNEEEGTNNTLPAIPDVKVTRLQPLQPFHLIDKLTIEPRSHKWKTNVKPSTYTSSVMSLTPIITTVADTTKVSFSLPQISPLDTYILEVKTDLFTPASNGSVISYGVKQTASNDYGDGLPEQTVVELIPRHQDAEQGFPDLGGPYKTPEEIYEEPPYEEREDVYSDGPYNTPIRSSYDPNDKLVNPGVPEVLNEIPLNEKWLTYTIRFQNEGNFSAKDVFIVDSLDQKFDKYSLTLLESSHPLSIETIKSNDENIVKFNFNDIYLDYTVNDELASQGYLKYMIKAKDDVVVNDIMENRAAIYFDQNPPIITNLTQNKYVEVVLSINQFDRDNQNVKLWPNPVNDMVNVKLSEALPFKVSIANLLGQVVQPNTNYKTNHLLDVSDLKIGIYILTVTAQNGNSQSVKFIKN
ncbi:putative secreted protein (Por secretion system target) [Winogradskyella epiphytica]|uniref:Putative secreted protein (Por secretion system target) n=1 Tax=Winogradskyella epiphytica TaxID=262005 RepID=A0A2V4WZ69_9FLAO|nr:T9SS type A sorting domain-containing protein [Winogradskyella epiphytica]PYE82966.1 putative secreted protein (Por secretion system target) [Winogradskyella epiphytica]GGW54875.1 hypothetical protein GCM10008085_02650 [Winogradskyella epiphytica]